MTAEQWSHAGFLGLLGFAVLTWFWLHFRRNPERGTQTLMGWALLFVGVLAAAGLWQDIQTGLDRQQASFTEAGQITVDRAYDGHYYLTLDINGSATRFVVDTGATGIVLSEPAARAAGLAGSDLIFYDIAHTANGSVRTAPVTLDTVALGPILDRNVKAYVTGGDMRTSLLGMDYLDRFERLTITGGQLTLER